MSVKYHPRNDWVLVELIDLGKSAKGVLLPQQSREGKRLKVIAIGPKVEKLSVGDSVLMNPSIEAFTLPGHNELFVIKQEHVAMVITGEEQ